MEFLKVNAKAVLTFVLATLLQAVTDAFNTGQVPTSLTEWGRYLGLSLIAGVVVWATGNKLNLPQILAGTKKLAPIEQTQVAKEALTELPNPISDKIVKGYPHWVTG